MPQTLPKFKGLIFPALRILDRCEPLRDNIKYVERALLQSGHIEKATG